jgi:hypothetical protein
MKTTTQNQIQDYLQLSSLEYEEMVQKHYWSWCHKYSTSARMLQCYFSNAAINNYFMTQWAKNENEFLAMVDKIPKRADRLSYHYHGCVVQVYKNYPAALLAQFKPKAKQEVPYLFKLNEFIFYAN